MKFQDVFSAITRPHTFSFWTLPFSDEVVPTCWKSDGLKWIHLRSLIWLHFFCRRGTSNGQRSKLMTFAWNSNCTMSPLPYRGDSIGFR
jgi:hypothetical protein